MSYDNITHEEMFTHKCGKVYRVRWIQDHDANSPLEWSDNHGIVVEMDWNPLNAEQMEQHIVDEEPDLEEETRLRMLKPLFTNTGRTVRRLYYDFFSTLELARRDWGIALIEDRVKAAEQDYKYLRGWYDDEWHWCILEVTLMVDGVPDFDMQYSVGGYESSLAFDTDLDEDKIDTINQAIKELEWDRRASLHPGQLELAL